MLIGGEVGHSWLVEPTIMDFSVYGRLVDNLSQNSAAAVSDPTAISPPHSWSRASGKATRRRRRRDAVGQGDRAVRLYTVYDGRYRSNFTSHTGTAGAEFRF